MPKIFISYRRADSQYVTDSIYEHMVRHFDEANVFLDVGNIPFGVDFRDYLREQIAEHDVILVIIGTEWAQIMQERAGQSNDFVRIEIENALKMKKHIIPVLVKNATMPDFGQLPESIADLQWRNSAIVRRHPDLTNDCKRLADGIKTYMQSRENRPTPTTNPTPPPATRPKSPVAKPDIRAQLQSILPEPFDLIDIPAGNFLYGRDNQTMVLPEFAIGKYPITYAQFQVFIDAKDGFKDPRWWQGLAVNQSDEPGDQKWKIANHPRENVSWYDALVFCRWLSWRVGAGYEIDKIEEWVVRLPTEYEWEKAARGIEGLDYPYGNSFDKTRANTRESGIGKTTPVTQYPQGASPYGVFDMSGNVWEWCLTEVNNPQKDAKAEGIRKDGWRMLCSSSFFNSRNLARTTRHIKDDPYNHNLNIGFRLCCPPSL